MLYPPSALDANQVLQHAFDESTQTLRTTATSVVVPGTVDVSISHLNDSIKLGDGTNLFSSTTVGPKVGLDVNIINATLDIAISHISDSIRIGDGTFLTSVTSLGELNVLDSQSLAKLLSIDSKLVDGNDIGDVTVNNGAGISAVNIQDGGNSITVDAIDLDIRDLSHIQDSIKLGDGVEFAAINSSNELQVRDDDLISVFVDGNDIGDVTVNNTSLNPVPVNISAIAVTDLDIRDLNASQDDVLTAGSNDGTSTGTIYHFVNNLFNQIVETEDRQQTITWADFGTKNERITQIDYTSSVISGTTARETYSYSLVGTKYRLDNVVRSLV